jgi:hypothetical protein
MPVKPTPFRVPIRDPNPGHGQNFPHNVPGFVSCASSGHSFHDLVDSFESLTPKAGADYIRLLLNIISIGTNI